MSLLDSMNTVSLLHGSYAMWNLAQCHPLLTTDKTVPNGYALTYHPFAAGTCLALAVAPTKVRLTHAVATMILCAHLLVGNNDDEIKILAQYHIGACVAYLIHNYFAEKEIRAIASTFKNKVTPIPLLGRLLGGWLALSQLGIAAYFSYHYVTGQYEPFLKEVLSTTDKIPLELLTPDFLKGVYLAGSLSVFGYGLSIGGCLINSVILQNSAEETVATLKSLAVNLSTQVLLHGIAWLTGAGGPDLHQYMYVHGPMSLPVLGMLGLCMFLSTPKKGVIPRRSSVARG